MPPDWIIAESLFTFQVPYTCTTTCFRNIGHTSEQRRLEKRERDPSQTEQNHTSRWSVSLNRQGNPWNPGACGGGGGRRERWPMPLPPRTAGVTGRARTGRRRRRVSFNAYGFWLPVWSSVRVWFFSRTFLEKKISHAWSTKYSLFAKTFQECV